MLVNPECMVDGDRKYMIVPIDDIKKLGPFHLDHRAENYYYFILPESEYDRLVDEKVFDQINDAVGSNIEPYESDEIQAEDCSECLEILRKNQITPNSYLYQALATAIKWNTEVLFYF